MPLSGYCEVLNLVNDAMPRIVWVIALLWATVIGILLFRKLAGSLAVTRLNMISFTLYCSLIPSAIGAAMLTADIGVHSYYMLERIPRENYRFVCGTVAYSMIVIPISALLVQGLLKTSGRRTLRWYFSRPVEGLAKPTTSVLLMSVLTLVSLASLIYIVCTMGGVSLFRAIHMSNLEVGLLRGEAKLGYGGNPYVRTFFATILPNILSYMCWVWWRRYHRPVWLIMFLVNFAITVIALTMTLEKAPLVRYLLGFLLLEIGLGRVRVRTVILWIAASLIVATTLSGFVSKASDLRSRLQPVAYRLVVGAIDSLFFYPDVFPKKADFLLGLSHPRFIAQLFNTPPERASRIVMTCVYPAEAESNRAGYMNTFFVGEAYANWGWAGVLISPWVVGLVIGILYFWLLSKPKTPAWLAAYAYVTLYVPMTGGFLDFIYNPPWLFVFSFAQIYWLIAEHSADRKTHPGSAPKRMPEMGDKVQSGSIDI